MPLTGKRAGKACRRQKYPVAERISLVAISRCMPLASIRRDQWGLPIHLCNQMQQGAIRPCFSACRARLPGCMAVPLTYCREQNIARFSSASKTAFLSPWRLHARGIAMGRHTSTNAHLCAMPFLITSSKLCISNHEACFGRWFKNVVRSAWSRIPQYFVPTLGTMKDSPSLTRILSTAFSERR